MAMAAILERARLWTRCLGSRCEALFESSDVDGDLAGRLSLRDGAIGIERAAQRELSLVQKRPELAVFDQSRGPAENVAVMPASLSR